MAMAMVITTLPLNAIFAFGSSNTSVKQYLVDSIDSDFTVGTGVSWDAGENAAYFDGSTTGFLTLNSNPLSGVTADSGFAISFDVKRYDNSVSMSRILDINDNTTSNTFAINGGIDGTNGEKYTILSKFEGAETRFNPNDLANNFAAEEKQGTWYTLTYVFDTDNRIYFYVDGTLKGSFSFVYSTTASRVALLTRTLVGASVYGQSTLDANFKGYIKNLRFFDDLYDLDYAKASYEAVMSKGVGFERMKNAYDKYVYIHEKEDAAAYGSTEFTTAQKQAAAKDLIIATANMGGFGSSESVAAADGSYTKSELVYGDEMKNVLYTYGISGNAAYTGTTKVGNYMYYGMQYGPIVFLYNGGTLACPINMFAHYERSGVLTATVKVRYCYPTTSNFSLVKIWHGTGTDAQTGYQNSDSNKADYVSSYSESNVSAALTKNSNDYWTNTLYYTGTLGNTTFSTTANVAYTAHSSNGNGTGTSTATSSMTTHIVNYKVLVDAVKAKMNGLDVTGYREGGLGTLLTQLDTATALDPMAEFVSNSTSLNVATAVSTTATNIQNAVNGITATATADSAAYASLRTVMDMSGTPAEGTYRALRDAYTGAANTWGYDATTYAAFKEEYERAVAAFDDVLTNGYTGTYDSKPVGSDGTSGTIANDLKAAFLALEGSAATAPTVSGNALLSATDTVTITNNEANTDDGKVYYTVSYDTGASKSGELTLANGASDTIAPFSFAEAEGASTALVTAQVIVDGNNSPAGSLNVTLYKYPTGSPNVLGKDETITLYSQNGADAGTIMYSYDGENFDAYSVPFAPFASSGAATRTIYVKEIGTDVTSSVGTITVARAASLAAYADPTPELGADYYEDTSSIKLATDNTYDTGSIRYKVKKASDSDFGSEQTYDENNGFDGSTYANESFIIIKAYGAGNEDNAQITTLYNQELYNPLAYQESFNDVTVTNGSTADVLQSESGYNMTAAANTISVVSGAGTYMSGSTSESHSWRNNVLKINANSTAPGPVVTLTRNPLNQAINAAAVRRNGVTISFWRHIEDTSGNTVSLAENSGDPTGYNWRNAIAFQKENDNSTYYIIEVNGVNSRRVDGTNYLDVVPENQDNTEHEMGAANGEWEHVAITINPNSGIKVYLNGVEHDYKYATGTGSFSDGNDAAAAAEILAFLSDGTTQMTLDNGVLYEGNDYDLFLDDIRLYTKPLTQVEINNMYVDEYSDTVTSTTSTSHDPTSVTVYTLNSGKKVGVEYIEYNNIPDSEIVSIDYYSFGTGMTIYHATDETQTHWEVLGDSEGRCGYQNQDLFYKDGAPADYTEALADVVTTAGFTADEISQGAGHLVWAPHVMYNLNRDCWVYYASMSYWGGTHSATFMATSNDPIKGYTYNSIVYQSNSHTPNSIDFASFYNADYTKLYFVMGSWNWNWKFGESGDNCIYGMELNIDGTAKYPELDSMYTNGQMIASCYRTAYEGGGESDGAGEGAFVQYIDGYYYLFVSYGTNGGSYTERVFRSTEPLGTYVGYNGISSTSTDTGHHGNQILAPFDIALYDNIFRSTGHNSIYKVKNLKDEWVYVNAVHGRPYASDSHEWKAVPDNALAKRQSGDVTGNVTLNNMIAVNEDGWLVMFPNQYNGTDSYSSRLTAKQIEGIYTASDMRMQVDSDWGNEYTYTMLADEAYTDRGIAFGVKDGITFTSKFYLSYDDTKKIQYITIYTDASVDPENATADQIRYKGVVGTHTGKDKYGNDKLIPMLAMLNEYSGNEYPHTLYIGEHSWAYRSGDVPDAADVVSDVDAVALDGVIYTHADDATETQVATNHGYDTDDVAKTSYALYGQEISDNFKYGTGTTNGERYTTLTVAYPYKIDLSNASAIYCYSDGERCRTGGYTGSLITAVPLNKNTTVGGFDILESGGRYTDTNQYWYDKSTGTAYTQAQVDAMSSAVLEGLNLVRYYGFKGSVSDYFSYNAAEGKYTEDGVELIISYIDIETNEQKQEFEFCYVMPNPAWAHTMAATRNLSNDTGNDRRSSVGNFNRFIDSWGTATPTYSHMLYDAATGDTTNEGYGNGVSGYLTDFESISSSTDLSSFALVSTLFNKYDDSEGVQSGSYSVQEHDNSGPNAYIANPDLVNVNYYVDYSDKQLYDIDGGSGLITTAANGVPTGYTFTMKTSSFKWKTYDDSSLFHLSSYARNTTKQKNSNQALSVTYHSDYDDEISPTPLSSSTYVVPTHLHDMTSILPEKYGDGESNFRTTSTYKMQTNAGPFVSHVTWSGDRVWTADEMLFHTDERRNSNASYKVQYRNRFLYYFTKHLDANGNIVDGSLAECTNSNPDNNSYGWLEGSTSNRPSYYDYSGQTAYKTGNNGKGNHNDWQGTAVFSGKYSVVPNEYQQIYDGYIYDSNDSKSKKAYAATIGDVSGSNATQLDVSAEYMANYILELGDYHKITDLGVSGGRFVGNETWHYYNIGVHTCDKGAMRQFAEEVLNQDIDLETYAETREIVTTGPIDSSKVSYASYKDYIRAVAKCMWFAEDPTNTTAGDIADEEQYANDYACAESDDMEYRTAYDAEGHAIYNTDTAGSNIFQDGQTTTDPVQAQLIKDVIEAYANLYDVTKYAEVESEYKKTKEFLEAAEEVEDENPGTYSAQSLNNYRNALNAIKEHAVNYYIYWDEGPNKDTTAEEDGKYHVLDGEGNPVIDAETGKEVTIDIVDTNLDNEEFWRKSALTGEEYEELKDFMRELRGSLAEPVDETPLTDQINNAVVPTLTDGEITFDQNGDYVSEEADKSKKGMDEEGIFDTEGAQVYSYNSWKELDDCLNVTTGTYAAYTEDTDDTRAQMLEDRTASAEDLALAIGANDLIDETAGSNKYATLGERNLKELLNTIDDVKYEILLDASDSDSPYRSRDQLAVDKKAAELAPLVTSPVDLVDNYNSYNNAYAIVSAVDLNKYIDPSLITAELGKRAPEVYIAATDAMEQYNARMSAYNAAHPGETQRILLTANSGVYGELKVLGIGETDPYTAALLTAVNTLDSDPETYVKKFKAQLTVSKLDADGNQASGFPQTLSQECYYGETFSFNVPGLTETTTTDAETGETTTTLDQAVKYSISPKEGLAANFDTAEVIGSQKWTYKGTTISRIADSNVEIAAEIVEDRSSTNDLCIKFYNIYGRLVQTSYVANAPTNTEGDPVVYNGETALYRAEEVPFYYFDHYEVEEVLTEAGGASQRIVGYNYRAKYTAEKSVQFTKPEGATLTGGRGDTASLDDLMTLSTEASDFYAWAVKDGDNKYAIASYDSSYSFYAADDTDFAMVTRVTDGDEYTYQVDGTELTAAMMSGTIGEFADNTGTQNYPYGADKYLKEKLDQKAPFIAVISSSVSKDGNNVPITDVDGKYIVKSYAIVTSGTSAKINNVTFTTGVTVGGTRKTATAAVTNINEYGQFTVTVKVKNSVPASCDGQAVLNYKFTYNYNDTDYTINAKDTTIRVVSQQ